MGSGETCGTSMCEKKRGGGPKSANGKANSSQNSTQHGVRAKSVVILEGESEEEYAKVVHGWNVIVQT